MTETMRRRYRDIGDRFRQSAEIATGKHQWDQARRMFLSAAREYLRVAMESDETLRRVWIEKADTMETMAARSQPDHQKCNNHSTEIDTEQVENESSGSEDAEHMLTLNDVAGLTRLKQAIMTRIIYPFQHPEISARFGKEAGGGIIMYGPPGVGKTLIARAVAGEIGAGFFSVGCSDIFSKYVGETEKNMRNIFQKAARADRAVLFLDEVEALLGRRGNQNSPVLDRLVPEFLSLTDGVGSGHNRLLLLAATNRPWDLDEATLREGRFGQMIYVGLPDIEARRFILDVHLKQVPMADDIDLDDLAGRLEGYSGADIAGFCREATDRPYLRQIETGQDQELTALDLNEVLAARRPSVTQAMLRQFDAFSANRGEVQP